MNRISFCVTVLLLLSATAFAQKTSTSTTVSTMSGAVSKVEPIYNRLTAVDGSNVSRLFSVVSTTVLTLDGNVTKLGYLKPGYGVAVEYSPSSTSKELIASKITASSSASGTTSTMSGTISSVDMTNSRLAASDGTNPFQFSVPSTATITLNGSATKLGYLKAGYSVKVAYAQSASGLVASTVAASSTTTAVKTIQ